MTGTGWALLLVLVLAVGWRLSWLATRVDRAHSRAERSWAVLDVALVRRAQRAIEVAGSPLVDPASALLVCDAAAGALQPDLSRESRELAETGLSHVLALVGLADLEPEQERATLARRLHNDAVATAQALRHRLVVRVFRLAGHAAEPRAFEMVDGSQLGWPSGEGR